VLPQFPLWYALRTRARCEKKIDTAMRRASITTFLPLVEELHRWSDRLKKIEAPLCFLLNELFGNPSVRISRERSQGQWQTDLVSNRDTRVTIAQFGANHDNHSKEQVPADSDVRRLHSDPWLAGGAN
jgi:hypothetical protein